MIIAAAIALVALGFAAALVKAVLSAGKGTQKMQDIAGAVQEGAQAYLTRQFKTLAVFVVIAVILLFLLPVNDVGDSETAVKIGRSLVFIVGRSVQRLHRWRGHGPGHAGQPPGRRGRPQGLAVVA